MSHLLPISLTLNLQYSLFIVLCVALEKQAEQYQHILQKTDPWSMGGMASATVCKWPTLEPHFVDQLILLWSREGLN